MSFFRRLICPALAASLSLVGTFAHAAPPPPVPPIADADRYQSYNLNSPTPTVNVTFPIFGDCTDIIVQINGVPLTLNTDFTCASASGGSNLALLPLPITDMVITFATSPTTNLPTVPPSSGFLEVIGLWHPRDLVQPTAPGINRREFNQSVSTLIASNREFYHYVNGGFPIYIGQNQTYGGTVGYVLGIGTNGKIAAFPTIGSGNVVFSPGGITVVAGKTLTSDNTITLSGTDGSALNIGAGGTLGPLAFQSAITPSQCPVFTQTANGCVPPPNASGTTEFLRQDGAWAVPPGGGGGSGNVSGSGSSTAGNFPCLNNTTTTAIVDCGIPSSVPDSNVLANVSGSAGKVGAVAPSTWFDHAYCNTVGYLLVRLTGRWTCSNALPINIVWMGADNTGANDISSVFNAAMTACNAAYVGANRPAGTVYIPPGQYAVDAGLLVAPHCNIIADPGAEIFIGATAPTNPTMLSGTFAGSNTSSSLADQSIQGGVWDCRGVNGATAWNFPYYGHYFNVHNFIMMNCTGTNSNYINLGNGTTDADGMYMHSWYFENTQFTTNYVQGKANAGIRANLISDSVFSDGMAEDVAIGVYIGGASGNIHFNNVHLWNYTGCMTIGFEFAGGGTWDYVDGGAIDGPMCSGAAGYAFEGGVNNHLRDSHYDVESSSATGCTACTGAGTYGVFLGSGAQLDASGDAFYGTASVPMLQDFTGTTTGLTAEGTSTGSVTTVLPKCTSLPTNGTCTIQ